MISATHDRGLDRRCADGEYNYRRSAAIDREQADALSRDDPSKDKLYESAARKENCAYHLMLERVGARPTLTQLRDGIGNESWLAALALLDLSTPVALDAARFTGWSRDGGRFTRDGNDPNGAAVFHPDPEMDWDAWCADVDAEGRGWSSTEKRLYQLVAALATDRPVHLSGVLDSLGSWQREVLRVLVEWASGGNNRDRRGRITIAAGSLR